MESKNMVGGIVSLAVVVICVAAIMMPVLNEATTTEKTFTNEGAFYVEADPSDTYTIEYDKATKQGVIYINDTALDLSFTTGYTIMALDKSMLRLQSSDSTLQYKGNGAYITGIVNADLTISNGTVSGTYQTTPGSDLDWPETTYTDVYIASPSEQELVMTEYNATSKVLGDSEIFALGQTMVNSVWYLFKITGTVEDGVTVACLDRTTGEEVEGAVISNLSINKTAVDGYLDLYDLTSITFTVTLADTSTANCTYSAYIIPAEVTAERSQHLSDAENMILNAIPALVIVALVIGALGVFVTSRRD